MPCTALKGRLNRLIELCPFPLGVLLLLAERT
jgi:hypothetical protein